MLEFLLIQMVSIIYPNFKIKYKGGGFRFDTISIKRGQCHAQCNYDNVHLYNNSIYIVHICQSIFSIIHVILSLRCLRCFLS